MQKILLCCFLLALVTSCSLYKGLKEINREEVKLYTYQFDGKDIRFCPMHHLGKQVFYDDVKKTVEESKKEGYIVYYELISTDFTTDTVLKNTIRRKVRRIKGIDGNFQDSIKGAYFEKFVPQPPYEQMGIGKGDVWADVNYLELMNHFESRYKAIVLDSMDINTPFGGAYNREPLLSKSEYNALIIDFRNQRLVDLLRAETHPKILILYGEGHRKDFERKIGQ